MRSGRMVGVAILALGAAVASVWITMSLWNGATGSGDQADVLALPMTFLSVLLAAVSLWTGFRAIRREERPDEIAARLAVSVRTTLQHSLDTALGVQYRIPLAEAEITLPGRGYLNAAAEAAALHWQHLSGATVGTGRSIRTIYDNARDHRLFVWGEAGSGKTVLLTRLALDLLADLDTTVWSTTRPVPVLLSLSQFGEADLAYGETDALGATDAVAAWVASSLTSFGLGLPDARRLVDAGLVLPILDGLDEMDSAATSPRAARLLAVLNQGWRAPVVMSGRPWNPNVPPVLAPILCDALQVVVRPLTIEAMCSYLDRRFPHPMDRARWQKVTEAARTRPAVASLLSNPWYLYLATTVYGPPTTNPAELAVIDHAGNAAGALVDGFITHALVHHADSRSRRWVVADVTRWLRTVASVQRRAARVNAGSDVDLYLPDLWMARTTRLPRLITALITAGPVAVVGLGLLPVGLFGFAVGVGLLLVAFRIFRRTRNTVSPVRRFDLRAVRRRGFMSKLLRDTFGTLVSSLTLGLAGAVTPGASQADIWWRRLSRVVGIAALGGVSGGLGTVIGSVDEAMTLADLVLPMLRGAGWGFTIGLCAGTANGVVLALADNLSTDVEAVSSMRRLVRQGVSYCVTIAVVSTVVWMLAAGIAASYLVGSRFAEPFGTVTGVVSGLLAGVVVGIVAVGTFGLAGLCMSALTVGKGFVWLRYALGVGAAVRHGALPARPALFIDWCIQAGLMRVSGTSVQFRHDDLRQRLEQRPEPPQPSLRQRLPGRALLTAGVARRLASTRMR